MPKYRKWFLAIPLLDWPKKIPDQVFCPLGPLAPPNGDNDNRKNLKYPSDLGRIFQAPSKGYPQFKKSASTLPFLLTSFHHASFPNLPSRNLVSPTRQRCRGGAKPRSPLLDGKLKKGKAWEVVRGVGQGYHNSLPRLTLDLHTPRK